MAATATSPRVLPAASIKVITAGVTGSLKRSSTVFGVAANTLPSEGSVETSEAWAEAPVAWPTIHSSIVKPAIRRIVGCNFTIGVSRLWDQFDTRGRPLAVMGVGGIGRNLDPATDPLLAFLHHREIQRTVG